MEYGSTRGRQRNAEGVWGNLKDSAQAHWERAAERVRQRRLAAPNRHASRASITATGGADPAAVHRRLNEVREADQKARAGDDASESRGAARKEGGRSGAGGSGQNGLLGTAKRVFKEFGEDHGTLMAAAVAFYLMLSLVPLIVVGVAVFAYVMSDVEARRTVIQFASQYVPQQRELLETSIDAVQRSRGTIGTVGLLTLAFTGTSGFATLETAINTTWKAPNRSFLWNKVYSILMMFLIGVLLIASLGVTAVVGWAGAIPGLGWLEYSAVAKTLALVLSVAISGFMFTAIYKFFPNTRVDWKPAAISGFLTAFLWELFKQGYTWYTSSKFQGDQAATYGVMASFVGLLTWIYYSSALVLLGSELTWVLQGCPGDEAARQDPAAPRKNEAEAEPVRRAA